MSGLRLRCGWLPARRVLHLMRFRMICRLMSRRLRLQLEHAASMLASAALRPALPLPAQPLPVRPAPGPMARNEILALCPSRLHPPSRPCDNRRGPGPMVSPRCPGPYQGLSLARRVGAPDRRRVALQILLNARIGIGTDTIPARGLVEWTWPSGWPWPLVALGADSCIVGDPFAKTLVPHFNASPGCPVAGTHIQIGHR
jgi:hypothetical protein